MWLCILYIYETREEIHHADDKYIFMYIYKSARPTSVCVLKYGIPKYKYIKLHVKKNDESLKIFFS